jgi:signal transduction histidine kinase
VLTDINNQYQSHRNFTIPENLPKAEFDTIIARQIREMAAQYPPIVVEAAGIKQYIYYRNSALITQLKYFPLVQLLVIGVFGFISYVAFSNSRRAEQNRVWVGLAKETAHQLGTPLSALMGWVEYLRSEGTLDGTGIVDELDKDVKRLEMITQRFSSIGSTPNLQLTELEPVVNNLLDYLRPRVSSRVILKVEALSPGLQAYINVPLFEWVVENVCKNAVDAMDARGYITIRLARSAKGKAIVDIIDTGKGIPKKQFSKVFEPGFTTKKRGWGLGLTLVKRIVDNYHHGKIFVYRSELGKGTTFRILLNRDGE